MAETGLVIPIDNAEAVVSPWRRFLDPQAACGVPAHVTVLYPFVDSGRVDDALRARLSHVIGAVECFDCCFSGCSWFGENVLWLAPDVPAPFIELTTVLWRAFPAYPPYGGAHSTVVPHLTVGEAGLVTNRQLRRAEQMLTTALPVTARVDRALLLAVDYAVGACTTLGEFPLGTP